MPTNRELGDPNGKQIVVGRLLAGSAAFLSPVMFVPSGSVAIAFEIVGVRDPAQGTPTLTVAMLQGARAGNLVDRGLTSPTNLAAIVASEEALLVDTVFGNYVQLQITCTVAACDVTVWAVAR